MIEESCIRCRDKREYLDAILCDAGFSSVLGEYFYIVNEKAESIYLLLVDKEVVYVGRTKALRKRIAQHRKNKKFDTVLAVDVKEEIAYCVEALLYDALKPKYNKERPNRRSISEEEYCYGNYNMPTTIFDNAMYANFELNTKNKCLTELGTNYFKRAMEAADKITSAIYYAQEVFEMDTEETS